MPAHGCAQIPRDIASQIEEGVSPEAAARSMSEAKHSPNEGVRQCTACTHVRRQALILPCLLTVCDEGVRPEWVHPQKLCALLHQPQSDWLAATIHGATPGCKFGCAV
jgi:hypothetical protein